MDAGGWLFGGNRLRVEMKIVMEIQHGYRKDDARIGQMTSVPMHFARTAINDIYQFHTQLLLHRSPIYGN